MPSSSELFRRAADDWEVFAEEDPLWAILTDPAKKGGRWDLREFLAAGERDFTSIAVEVDSLQPPLAREAALDFGCGIGRTTFPLATRFTRVVGLDAAPSMVERARRINPDPARIEFVVSASPALPFPNASFDFVHSHLVLQHVPPDHALGYVREFIRILRPGGAVYFVLPVRFPGRPGRQSRPTEFTFGPRKATMWMHCVPISETARALEEAGAAIERIRVAEEPGPVHYAFYLARPDPAASHPGTHG
jgi:SAM-dependent methyltransferase